MVEASEMDGRIQALVAQRDNAMNQVVILQGQLNKALLELEALKKPAEESKAAA